MIRESIAGMASDLKSGGSGNISFLYATAIAEHGRSFEATGAYQAYGRVALTAPTHPVTFSVAALSLVGIAVLGMVIPAWRALSVDPSVALRAE